MAELGTGWISVTVDGSKITPGIKKALGEAEPTYSKAGDSGGKSFGAKFSSTAGAALKKGGLAAGAAGGAAVAAGLTKGIGRLNSIEQAEAKLKGLGNSTAQVGSIMENALASVKGTSFGLEEAATSAAGLVAAGIKPGQELEQILTTVGDTATIAGTSMADMGTIFSSVAARGKLQGDDMLQLLSRGVPVLQLLADETGKTSGEISDMVSKGEIDFKTFSNAMQRGMGGAALEAGNTAQGAFKNMGAALGRLGATIAGPFFDQAAGGFSGVTDALDQMNDRAKPVMEEFASWMTGQGIPAVKEFASSAVSAFQELAASDAVQNAMTATKTAISGVVDAGKAIAPAMAGIASSLSTAVGALGISTWQLAATVIGDVAVVVESLAGPLQHIADLMAAHPAIVTAAVGAWAGFKTIPGMISKVATGIAGVTGASKALSGVSNPMKQLTTALSPIGEKAKLVGGSMQEAAVQTRAFAAQHPEMSKMGVAVQALGNNVPIIGKMGDAYTKASAGLKAFSAQQKIMSATAAGAAERSKDLFLTVDRIGASAFRSATGSVASFAGTLRGAGAAAMTGFRGAASGLMTMMGGPWGAALMAAAGAAMFVADSMQKMKEQQRLSAELAKTGEVAYREMFDTLVKGGDKIESSTKQVSKLRENLSDLGKTDHGGVFRFMDEMGVKVNSLKGLVDPLSKAQAEQVKNQLDTADSAEKAAAKLDELGMSDEDVARKVNASATDYSAFTASLREAGKGGEELANHLDEMREANQLAEQTFHDLGPAMSNVASVIEDLSGKAEIGKDDILDFHHALQGLTDGGGDAAEAAGELTKAINDVTTSSETFEDVQIKTNGAIDRNTMGGVKFAEAVQSLGDAFVSSAAASGDTRGEWERSAQSFYELGESAGLSKEQMDQVLYTLQLTPDQVDTRINVAGDEAKMELAAVGEKLRGLATGETTTTISVNDQEARDALENAGFELSDFDEKTGTAKIDVRDEEAKAKLIWMTENGFPAIDAANPTARANLDTENLEFSAEYARMTIDTIDKSRPISVADLDTNQLTAKQVEALQRIGVLDAQTAQPNGDIDLSQFNDHEQVMIAKILSLSGQTAKPAATLVKDELDKGTDDGKNKVNDLNKQKAEPKAKLDPKPVQDGARQAQSAIDGIHGKEVTVSFRAEYTGDWDKASRSGKWTGGLWTGPAYKDGGHHGGYRLPKTGPGTDERDGFLAFDKNNVPAARLDAGEWIINRGSSEKYNRELAQINAGTFPKLPGYADGGRAGVRHANDIIEFAKGIEGKPYVWGGVNWGDCSGGMSAISRYAVGLDPFGGRFATGNEADALQQLGFQLGRGSRGDLRIGWFNGGPWGGHTAGTLPNETNVEMGGARGNGQFGGGAAGAWDPQFTDHAFLPVPTKWVSNLEGMPDTNGFTVGGGGDTSTPGTTTTGTSTVTKEKRPTSWSEVAGIAGEAGAKGLMGDLLNVLGIPDTPPALEAWQQFQDANARDAQEVEKNTTAGTVNVDAPEVNIPDSINRTVEISYDPSRGAEQWRSTVEMALKRVGGSLGDTDRTVQQIDNESGGDPNITNDWDSNAANGDPSVGLLQVIRSTFEANRDPDLPDDQKHPLANIVAALNYVNGRYGGPANIWPTRAGYASGGPVSGPGGRKADRIPAWLSDMEHVVNATDAIANRDLIGAINAGFPAQQVMSGLLDANRELSVAAAGGDGGFGSLTALLGEDHARLVAEMAADVGAVSSSGGGQQMVVNNQFIAANPEEMHRQYRREAAKYSRGKVGAR